MRETVRPLVDCAGEALPGAGHDDEDHHRSGILIVYASFGDPLLSTIHTRSTTRTTGEEPSVSVSEHEPLKHKAHSSYAPSYAECPADTAGITDGGEGIVATTSRPEDLRTAAGSATPSAQSVPQVSIQRPAAPVSVDILCLMIRIDIVLQTPATQNRSRGGMSCSEHAALAVGEHASCSIRPASCAATHVQRVHPSCPRIVVFWLDSTRASLSTGRDSILSSGPSRPRTESTSTALP
jgi:hypothetical protein